ncbi:amino acid ABC transporter substrate-binding protein [Cellulomonas sp. APG4]|uniref:amino acid ABC transporter substrate-binding protein n=1 Tax=Cellulomonas sp. APG4 TaxID=1538656 RepID=UPI00137A38F0|nr:amino acid ABC transporter substrate-binding protein [Cellulomonas sp. APG4]NCT89986.1 amino acid ABC transporter substrate-binding protein [Cellulomonas sp. APG4]
MSARRLTRSRARGAAVVAGAALLLTACSSGGGGGAEEEGDDDGPIRIGISLPLTGDFSEPGKGVQNGYEIWRDEINEAGGLLGRQVELVILDDQSNADRVVADYEALITQEEVDLIFGPFSSRLVLPSARVAEEYGMLFVEPAGAAEDIFAAGYRNLFYAAPAVADTHYDYLFDHLMSLPDGERPETASFASMDDPLAMGAANGLKAKLEEAGVEILVDEIYPPNTTDFSGIAAQLAEADADLLVGGTQYQDGVNMILAVRQLGYQPRMAAFTTAPTLPEFVEAIGADKVDGIMTPNGYSPAAEYEGNANFVEMVMEKEGREPTEDEANAYTVGQVVTAAVEAVGCAEQGDCQTELVDWLHENEVATIVGDLRWDEAGRPNGAHFIQQYVDGSPEIVLPEDQATAEFIAVKPEW